jgi:hypothetical protein
MDWQLFRPLRELQGTSRLIGARYEYINQIYRLLTFDLISNGNRWSFEALSNKNLSYTIEPHMNKYQSEDVFSLTVDILTVVTVWSHIILLMLIANSIDGDASGQFPLLSCCFEGPQALQQLKISDLNLRNISHADIYFASLWNT